MYLVMRNQKILIVDDDQDIVSAINTILTMEGYKVETAFNGTDCIDCVKETKPDLILLDLMLPDMHGKDVAQKIRKNNDLKDIPIVVMSASRDAHQVAQDIRAQDCIDKPFEVSHLLETVSKHLPN